MDPSQRERIRDDLRGAVRGDLLFDDLSRVLYSTDASIFQVEPLGVVVPRDEADVQALVRYAGENHVPLVPRGAGSGLAGESLGEGLVVDLSRHFRAILDVGSDTVRVQPGVVLRTLNTRLAQEGRRFAPDPASGEQCTIGGMLATNASGARAVRHGYTRDHVQALRLVLDTGEAVAAGAESRWPRPEARPGRLEDIVASVATLLGQHAGVVKTCQPRTPYNRCGYLLADVLTAERVDLPRLLVGSEGTLALFTEATLRTVPLPAGRGLVLLGFDTLEGALRAAQYALTTGVAACELMDRRLLSLARGTEADGLALILAAAEAVLLVEYESVTPTEAPAAAAALADKLHRADRAALFALAAREPDEMARFWQLREAVLPALFGLRGSAQPVPFVEDVGVPVEALPACLHGMQEVLQQQETTASFFVHAATGQIHLRPFLDLADPQDASKLWAIADSVYELALGLGGTISAQHGTGLARTPWVAQQYGRLYPVFRELKAVFDPRHLFNPGKIVGAEAGRPRWPLRQGVRGQESRVRSQGVRNGAEDPPQTPDPRLLTPVLNWQPVQSAAECLKCNGCGECRTESPQQRMCPIFRAEHTEAATPRAKANLLRHLLRESDPARLSADDVREVADLCVNCKMCAAECPAHVNIPKLMLETKAANVARHGLRRSDWALARTENLARLGSRLAFVANALLGSRRARWLLEKLFGVSRQRRLPPFAPQTFLRRARKRGWTRPPRSDRPRVVYFTDLFANYNDPSIAEAAVAVLHHNGVEVYVPPGQRGCGMAPLAYGDVETARETVRHNLRLLAEPARDGYAVVCSEPTAALMFRHDALDLFGEAHALDDADARLVAGRVVELTAYLGDLHRGGRLRTDFRPLPLTVGHHVPCHLKALGRAPDGPGLLALIPGLRGRTIDVGCSGMAGAFGLQAENYALSLAAGRPMLKEMARPEYGCASTECSTCRMQIEEGSGKRTLHPVQYLALAYGLMPELARRLDVPVRDLVL